ncbi:hypothetical protein PRZ48_012107 [Zasmidium cellare]|uniref:AMP-dependent synthetase/ligase domain-containing protein n=1 Tax=Zasmidium cellare TaxID=395010 RepID=A0ABR0E3Y5_ZASCE|nr:hypothetical protein PRZ48_012107 [Zasmidium cellare]
MTSTKGREDCPFGKTPLPTLIDTLARNDPGRPFAEIATGSPGNYQYQTVSIRQFAKAIDRAAFWMEDTFGKKANSYIAYAGPQDLRYLFFLFGAVKSGNTICRIIDLRVPKANGSLVEAYGCKSIILPSQGPFTSMFTQTIEERGLEVVTAPDSAFFLNGTPAASYPWNIAPDRAKFMPYVGMQTSGTTGTPKPVLNTHGKVMAQDVFNGLPGMGQEPIADSIFAGRRILNTFPFFHGAGIGIMEKALIFPGTLVIPPPGLASEEAIVDMIEGRNIQIACLPPSIVADLTKTAAGRRSLARLEYVYTGGAALPTEAAEIVNSKSHLIMGYGASEIGHAPTHLMDKSDSQYYKFSTLWPHEMHDRGAGMYELVMVRKPELDDYQCVFTLFPDIKEFRTNDHFSKHPDPGKAGF